MAKKTKRKVVKAATKKVAKRSSSTKGFSIKIPQKMHAAFVEKAGGKNPTKFITGELKKIAGI